VPEQLFDVTAFPIMLVLMYTYLFGGALAGSPREYIQYLLPGILVMSVTMITMYTGLAVNIDIEKGVFDRFRSLPIWRPVDAGRLSARGRPALHDGVGRDAVGGPDHGLPPGRRRSRECSAGWSC
jgi:hypothetical protein